jgi:hypothetical protein
LAYLLEHDGWSQTIGEMFRQLGEQAHLPGAALVIPLHFPENCVKNLASFCDSGLQFRAYLNAITNINHFTKLQGCET